MNYTDTSLRKMRSKATAAFKIYRDFILRLGKMQHSRLDMLMSACHNEEFKKIDCTECANCCKTISPAMYATDVSRMAKALRMKPAEFIGSYLDLDHDGSYVFKSVPCTFLDSENLCRIYEARPKACREYPHTDRKRFYQILNLTAQNVKTCPAVFNIIEKLKSDM